MFVTCVAILVWSLCIFWLKSVSYAVGRISVAVCLCGSVTCSVVAGGEVYDGARTIWNTVFNCTCAAKPYRSITSYMLFLGMCFYQPCL